MLKILFCGDVMGKAGREAVVRYVPFLRQRLHLDCVIVNGENIAGGFGLTEKYCRALFLAGVDLITTGNHVWDKPEILSYIAHESRLLRPLNLPSEGRGATVVSVRDKRILVVNVMGRLFMPLCDDPFPLLDKALPAGRPTHYGLDAVVVDIHAEASSEKQSVGRFCDGRATLVVGTHTHVPTIDSVIFQGGTAFQTDAGMCGSYDSVIGMKTQPSLDRMMGVVPRPRLEPARGDPTLCGVMVTTNNKGLAETILPIRIGGLLDSPLPPEQSAH